MSRRNSPDGRWPASSHDRALARVVCFVALNGFPPSSFSFTRSLDLSAHGPLQRRPRLALIALPLLGRLALGRPGVDGRDFLLERGVGQPVALEGVEALELW